MTVEFRLEGGAGFARLSSALKAAGNGGLSRELDKGLRAAAKDVEAEVRDHTDEYMPAGYERVFAVSLSFRTEIRRGPNHRVTIVPSGKGRSRQRDLVRLDRGELRHPVFGRWRTRRGRFADRHRVRSPWVEQRIRTHWFTEPAARAQPDAVRRMQAAMQAVTDKIAKAV